MNDIMEKATKTLQEQIGQDKIMALATRNGDGVAVRTVNVYTYDGCFYFITEAGSNKYHQIMQNNKVALSVNAIQITGIATPLEHPVHEANRNFVCFMEKQLPQQFNRFNGKSIMRLIKIKPANASLIILEAGEGYVIDFEKNMAAPIEHEM